MKPAIGIHANGSGSRDGIGDYMRRLDENGIPFVICATNDDGLAEEALQYSNAEHVIIYRLTHSLDGHDDTPRFTGDASNYTETAAEYADRFLDAYESKRVVREQGGKIWLALLNECDQNQIEYIHNLSADVAEIFRERGYRTVAPNWATGNPRESDLGSPATVRLLQYASEHHDTFAIGIHEYSLNDALDHQYPNLVGTWRLWEGIRRAHGIPAVRYMAKEFGWHNNNIPADHVAIEQLDALMNSDWPSIPRALWTVGFSAEYGNLPEQVMRFMPRLTDWIINNDYEYKEDNSVTQIVVPEPVELKPEPTTPERVHTLNVVTHVLPQDATLAESVYVLGRAFERKQTVSWSKDAAVSEHARPTTSDDSELILWGKLERHEPDIVQWLLDNGAKQVARAMFEFEEEEKPTKPTELTQTAPFPARDDVFGLHLSADPDISDAEVELIQRIRPKLLKVMTNHDVRRLRAVFNTYRPEVVILRIFQDGWNRIVDPSDIVRWNLPDIRQKLDVIGDVETWIEIHNEPNLMAEGMWTNWANGAEFSRWMNDIAHRLRNEGIKTPLLSPGLSPGGDVPNIRYDSNRFFDEMDFDRVDGAAVHQYWRDNGVNRALNELSTVMKKIAPKLTTPTVFVTEASNNKHYKARDKGEQYVRFARGAAELGVSGVAYFVASASDPQFAHETWLDKPEMIHVVREARVVTGAKMA